MGKTTTVKNIPSALYERLKARALEHRRSVNAEIIHCLETGLDAEPVVPERFLARLDALQAEPYPPLTDEMLREARESGRP